MLVGSILIYISNNKSDDQRLGLQGYSMIRSVHPSNTKRGGVCIYSKEHLSFVRRDDITSLDECIVGEIKVKNSKCFITCLYRSPSQTAYETNASLSGLEQTWCNIAMESPTCSFVLGDINAKCTNWWANGVNNLCGLEFYTLSSLLGYSQLINEPTNFEPNMSPSCIDLLFASQPNLVVESSVHPSLSNTCPHQIIFAKISFKVFLPSRMNGKFGIIIVLKFLLFRGVLKTLTGVGLLKTSVLMTKLNFFNYTSLNIFRNFIPHETIKCSNRDPPWLNKEIKNALRHKNRLCKKYISGGLKQEDETNLRETSNFVSNLITDAKSSYFTNLGKRLNDPLTGPKTYLSILKRLKAHNHLFWPIF